MSGRLAEQTRNPLLDVACVMETLRRRLPECRTGLRLDGADLLDVRYLEGGRECAVGYRLRFTSLSGGGLSSQPVTLYRRDGRFFDTSRVADGYARVEERVLDAPLVDLPELGAVLRPFPIDPSLPGLLDAHDRGFMKTALRTCLDGRIRSVKVRLMSYTIGARATLQLRLRHDDREERIVGKLNASRPLAETMAGNWALFKRTHEAFGQSRPLGVVQSINLSLQSWIDGARLNEFVEDPAFAGYLEQIGRAAATLHRQSLPLTRVCDAAREMKSLERRFAILSEFHAERGRTSELKRRLLAAIDGELRTCAPVHGDFHHANVLVAGDRAHLIDFDEMGMGDPMLDVGRFVVSLALPSLRVFGDLRLCDLAAARMLGAYAEAAPVDQRRLALCESLAYVTSAATTFRLQRQSWQQDMALLVERAQQRLERACAAPRKASELPVSTPDTEFWLGEPDYVALTLKPYAWLNRRAEVVHVRPLDLQVGNGKIKGRYHVRLEGPGERSTLSLRVLANDHLQPRALQCTLLAMRTAGPIRLELPEVWGTVQPLGAVFYTIPHGPRLSTVIAERPELAEHLALALADLQRLAVDCGRSRSLAGALRQLAAGRSGREEFERFADERVPTLAGVDLDHLTDMKDRIGLTRPDALAMAHPLLAAGRLAAAIDAADAGAADRFRRCYIEATGRPPDDLARFESMYREIR
jgi:Ser/Thr protein kinase RdoA (MazF antagonist)